MKRKLRLGVILVALLIGGGLLYGGGQQQSTETRREEKGFSWTKYSGTTIRVVHPGIPYITIVEPLISEFTALTGIKVDLEALPESSMRQKLTVELVARSQNIDVYASQTVQEGLKYHKAGWYTDVEKYANNPDMTSPDYDFADFSPSSLEASKVKGMLVGIPEISNTQMMYVRSDLLEQYGLKVDTLEELEAAARKLTGIEKDFYGITLRGKAAAATSQWVSFLYSLGGSWLKADGSPAINTAEALEAFDLYGKLVREYAAPGTINNTWQQCLPLFTNGKAAMWIDGAVFSAPVTNPNESKVAEQVGFRPFPKGRAGSKPFINNWILCVSPYSVKKEAAWYFIQWATSKEIDRKIALAGIGPTRKSTWEFEGYVNSDFLAKHPDYLHAFRTNLVNAQPYQQAPVEPVNEFRDIVGNVLIVAIQGGDVKKAADEANRLCEELLAKYK